MVIATPFVAQVPGGGSDPLVNPDTGIATQAFFLFLVALFKRTGDAQGVDALAVQFAADAAAIAAAAATAAAAVATVTAGNAQTGADASLKKASNLSDVVNVNTSRTNLNIGPATAGWADPTGTGARTTFNMDLALPAGAAYSQAEVTAIANQVIVLQKRLGQLILDEITAQTITH